MVKNLFITGGLGQDGRIICKLLKRKKLNINIITKSKKVNVNKKINYIISNLLNKKKIEAIFKKQKPDIVLHLASNNPSHLENNYEKFYKNNLISTKNIFYTTFKANKKAKFISCSSSQIFKKRNGIVNENSKIQASTNYTKFRIQSHNLMLKYKKINKIKYSNIILFNHDSKYRNQKFIIPRIIRAIYEKNINFLNEILKSNIASDFSHAEDICKGIIKIMFSNKNMDAVILSSGKLTLLNKIIYNIVNKNRINIKIKYPKKLAKGLIGNNILAKNKFNWTPKKNIFEAANEIYKTHKKLYLKFIK